MIDQAPEPLRKRSRLNIWRVAGTLFSFSLLVYLVWLQGWDEFAQAFHQLSLWIFFAALGLILASRVAVTLRWHALLRSAGVKIPMGQSLRLVFMGLFASNFLPSTVGGDLVRLAGSIYLHLDAGISAASLLVDRLVGMAGMALMLPFGLAAILRTPVELGTGLHSPVWPIIAGIAPRGLFQRLWDKGITFGKRLLQSAAYWLRHPVSLGLPFLFTLCHMALTFFSIAVLLAGLGEQIPFWIIAGLWSLSYFISLAPVSINGLGLQEASIAYLYTEFGGVSMQAALALAVLLRLLFLLSSLPGVLFLPDILRPLPAINAPGGPPGADQPLS